MRKGRPVRPTVVTTRGSGKGSSSSADPAAAARDARIGHELSMPSDESEDRPDAGAWPAGRSAVDFLISKDRLEHVTGDSRTQDADRLIRDASRRLESANSLLGSDHGSAFSLAYDAYRMAAESLLVRQGLRATGGDGSHRTVEDAISNQFGNEIAAFTKPTFERFRQMRNAVQYPDHEAPELDDDDARWATGIAGEAVSGVQRLTSDVDLVPYRSSS